MKIESTFLVLGRSKLALVCMKVKKPITYDFIFWFESNVQKLESCLVLIIWKMDCSFDSISDQFAHDFIPFIELISQEGCAKSVG